MFRKIHHRKGQNTAEYAILISLVVAGIIAMQTYAQRALQGRVQAASTLLSEQGTTEFDEGSGWELDNIPQYEPYYLESAYNIDRNEARSQILTKGADRSVKHTEDSNRTRETGGYQSSNYNAEQFKEAWE